MRFHPLTEEELQASSLLTEGLYNYKVIKSEELISKAGNEYISLTLKVTDLNGGDHLVFTNLSLIKLLKHFCDVNNMQDLYNSGDIEAEQCMGRSSGRVLIGIEPEKQNPNGGVYKAKNIVKDYVTSLPGSPLKPLDNNDFINDEEPF